MRAKRAPQRSLFDAGYPDHDMGRALALMSSLLDEHPEFLEWIAADVDRGVVSSVGRRGLPCEVILRCGILKHLWQSDYRELEFVPGRLRLGEALHTRRSAAAPEALCAAALHRGRSGRGVGSGSTGSCWAGPATTSSRRAARCASTAP